MAVFRFTIPDEYLSRVVEALNGLHPQPTEIDPDGPSSQARAAAEAAEAEGTLPAPDFRLRYTPQQWAKERTKQWLRDQVVLWETKAAERAARNAVVVPDDIIQD